MKDCCENLKSFLSAIEGLVTIAECSRNFDEATQCLAMIGRCAANMIESIHKLEEHIAIQQFGGEIKNNTSR